MTMEWVVLEPVLEPVLVPELEALDAPPWPLDEPVDDELPPGAI
jgi:hypothetical protein